MTDIDAVFVHFQKILDAVGENIGPPLAELAGPRGACITASGENTESAKCYMVVVVANHLADALRAWLKEKAVEQMEIASRGDGAGKLIVQGVTPEDFAKIKAAHDSRLN